MDTKVADRNERRRTHRARRRAIVVLVTLAAALVVRSAAGASPAAAPGAPVCRDIANATTTLYLTGEACPPQGLAADLGYEPVLERTPAGWRVTRPTAADGGCSGPLADDGLFWSFGGACRAHDYGYDLVRLGVGNRADADEQLYRDMKATCAAENAVARPACKTIADSVHAVLWVGHVSPGFEPTAVSPR